MGAVTVSLASGSALGGGAEGDQLSAIENLTGSAYGDALTGDGGANVLSGLAGNDSLQGGAGDDSYRFSAGDGVDRITETGGVNRIDFSGVDASELWFAHENDDLVIYHLGTADK